MSPACDLFGKARPHTPRTVQPPGGPITSGIKRSKSHNATYIEITDDQPLTISQARATRHNVLRCSLVVVVMKTTGR
ncbi:hypothetical protein CcaverHIS641_0310880 [Cutaneotrichosporon cavernicola]|nr:hypothetical protein CcaverHIS641_0310880 [Cutaneotrichosporon cavernicola]